MLLLLLLLLLHIAKGQGHIAKGQTSTNTLNTLLQLHKDSNTNLLHTIIVTITNR